MKWQRRAGMAQRKRLCATCATSLAGLWEQAKEVVYACLCLSCGPGQESGIHPGSLSVGPQDHRAATGKSSGGSGRNPKAAAVGGPCLSSSSWQDLSGLNPRPAHTDPAQWHRVHHLDGDERKGLKQEWKRMEHQSFMQYDATGLPEMPSHPFLPVPTA